MFPIILIFLPVIAIAVAVGVVRHGGRRSMRVVEAQVHVNEFRRFHFHSDADNFLSFPFRLFQIIAFPPRECIICRRRYRLHHQFIILPRCGHVYHANCIRSWLAETRSNQSCPLCRRIVFNGDDMTSEMTSSSSDESTSFSSTAATYGSSAPHPLPIEEGVSDASSSSVASSSTTQPLHASFENDEIVEEPVELEPSRPVPVAESGESNVVGDGAPGEGGVPGQAKPDDVEQGCFPRCFIRPKRVEAPIESESGELHVSEVGPMGCFSRCAWLTKRKKIGAPPNGHGGSGQPNRMGVGVGVRFFYRCFNSVWIRKPKKMNS